MSAAREPLPIVADADAKGATRVRVTLSTGGQLFGHVSPLDAGRAWLGLYPTADMGLDAVVWVNVAHVVTVERSA